MSKAIYKKGKERKEVEIGDFFSKGNRFYIVNTLTSDGHSKIISVNLVDIVGGGSYSSVGIEEIREQFERLATGTITIMIGEGETKWI
jgi:hypothetical protein